MKTKRKTNFDCHTQSVQVDLANRKYFASGDCNAFTKMPVQREFKFENELKSF